jgi:CRISPR-associated protein Csx10
MKIKMELLSNAIPATGEGRGSIIDVEVVSDDYGLPYIPAKRIKGILRENAWHLVNADKMDRNSLNNIFGVTGGNEGVLVLSNGYPLNYRDLKVFLENIREELPKIILNKETVLNYYTQIVSATAIENGIAKENSLRMVRALRRGLFFEFDIDLPHEYLDDLQTICKVTRFFGLNRNRGFGHIKMTLENIKKSKKYHNENFVANDSLQLDIETLSGILTTNKVGNGQISEDSIPGSSILGLMARYYIKYYRLGKDAHKDKDFLDIFLNNKVQFYNGYPVINDERSIPAPISITKEKNKQDEYFDTANPYDYRKITENDIITKGGAKPFIMIKDNGEFIEKSVLKITSYHHSRPLANRNKGRPDKDEGEFFTFEAVNKDMHFRSIIRGEQTLLAKLQKALPSDTFTAYLGKSKNSQYGHCKLTITKNPKNETVTIDSGNFFCRCVAL